MSEEQKVNEEEEVDVLTSCLEDILDGIAELSDEATMKSLPEEKKKELVYEIYNSVLELENDLKNMRSNMRKTFKVKDLEVKTWLVNRDKQADKPAEVIIQALPIEVKVETVAKKKKVVKSA